MKIEIGPHVLYHGDALEILPSLQAHVIVTNRGSGRWPRSEPKYINGVELWKCSACQETKPRSDFYSKKKRWNGIGSDCKKCHIACSMKTRDPEGVRQRARKYMKRNYALNPEKYREKGRKAKRNKDQKYYARYVLNNSVQSGIIKRPECCSECGSDGKIHGHHHDYSEPLNVEWLCTLCHGKRHRKNG